MKKKIVHVIWALPFGGAERQVVTLATRANRERYDVKVVCLTEGGPLAEEIRSHGIPVTVLDKQPGIDLATLHRLSCELENFNADIVHTHIFTANLWGRLAAFLANTPVKIVHEHSTFTLDRPKNLRLEKFLLPMTDKIIAVSENIHDRFLREAKYPAQKITTVHNGICLEPLDEDFDHQKLREEIGARDNEKLIGIVGMLEPRKDHVTFLKAAKEILAKRQDIRFLLAGDGPLKNELQEFARSLNIDSQVNFLGWRGDVSRLVRIFDVYVSSSVTEGISIALLEAMYARTPVVVTPVGGNLEVIKDGENGILADVGASPNRNPEILAEKIIQVISNTELSSKIGEAARQTIKGHFSAEAMMNNIENIYEEALAKKS